MLRTPFLIVNPKSYLSRDQALRLGDCANRLSTEFGTDIFMTAQPLHLAELVNAAPDLVVTAQHLDAEQSESGMGLVRPECLAEVGARAVILNHASRRMTVSDLDLAIRSAEKYGLLTLVCADSERQCQAVATLGPTIVVCESTPHIGTGTMIGGDYAARTTTAVKQVNPQILVAQAAGVSHGADVLRLLEQGADGSGGTTAFIRSSDWESVMRDMLTAITAFRNRQSSLGR